MKGLTTLLGPLVLIAGMAVTVFAWGPDWEIGNPMLGAWDAASDAGIAYGNSFSEQIGRLESLNPESKESTTAIQNRTESPEPYNSDPDLEKSKTLQKGINESPVQSDGKQSNNDVRTRKRGFDDVDRFGHPMGMYGMGLGSLGN